MAELLPVNPSVLEDAARLVRRALERADRGDAEALQELVRMASAEALETTLTRVAVFADRCAPTLDELKVNAGQFSADAAALRHEVSLVANVLNQAAGRAVVVELRAPERAP